VLRRTLNDQCLPDFIVSAWMTADMQLSLLLGRVGWQRGVIPNPGRPGIIG
jgi:hypothetical protein